MVPLSVSTLPFCVSDIREQCMNRGLGKQKTIRIRASIFWVRFSAVGGKFVPGKLNFINWFYSSKSPDHSLLLQPSKWCKTSEAREPGKVAVPRTNGLWNENAQPTCSAWPPHSGELQLALAKQRGKQEESCPRFESTESWESLTNENSSGQYSSQTRKIWPFN